MKVLFVTKGSATKEGGDPAARYRALPLQRKLMASGIDCQIVTNTDGVIGKLRLLMMARGVDLIFIQRRLLPRWLLRGLKKRCPAIVFDFDDAIFINSDGSTSRSRSHKFQAVIDVASMVVAGNDYLLQHCPAEKSILMPTPVDEKKYAQRVDKSNGCILVWIGSGSTRKYLEQHRKVLEQIGLDCAGVSLRVISDFNFHLVNMKVENVPWTRQGEAAALSSADIGIAPMIDNPWTRGKCALKVIQYMAAGLPVISAKVGANKQVVIDGVTGLVVDTDNQWLDAVSRLSSNQSEREQFGQAGLLRVQQNYSEQVIVEQLLAHLDERRLLTINQGVSIQS